MPYSEGLKQFGGPGSGRHAGTAAGKEWQHGKGSGIKFVNYDKTPGGVANFGIAKLNLGDTEKEALKNLADQFGIKASQENIPLDKLTATQDHLHSDNSYLKEGTKPDPITVMRVNGVDYVVDGHHRLGAAASKGETRIPANVFKLSNSQTKAVTDYVENG